MISKEITLCGKKLTLGYCFATEIGFKTIADCDIEQFIVEVAQMFNSDAPVVPDMKKCLSLIHASALAYYEQQKQDVPISIEEMMYQLKPQELGAALATVLQLRGEFYHVPSDEPDDKPKDGDDDKPKNA